MVKMLNGLLILGGNPSGVRIRKYNNGWWNGPNFYGFARLKEN